MKISIVICTYNKKERLLLVLKNFELVLKKMKIDYEILVCNDGGEPIDEYISSHNLNLSIKIMNFKHIGRAQIRNAGALETNGDIILFNDDDIIINPDCFSYHVHVHSNVSNAVVLGKYKQVYFTDEELAYGHVIGLDHTELKKISHDDIHEICTKDQIFKTQESSRHWLCGTTGNFSVSKKNYNRAGGFDYNFHGWGYEDIELSYRLSKMGCRFYCNIEYCNYHLDHFRNKQNMMKDMQNNILYFYHKYNNDQDISSYWDFLLGKISLGEFDEMLFRELDMANYNVKYTGLLRSNLKSIGEY